MRKILACALAAVLLAGCGSGSLLGNNDALAASVGSRASSAASNSVNSKINSDRIAPALNSVKAAGRNSGTITGVLDVSEFDNATIDLTTTLGRMIIKGRDLKVKNLNLEKGETDIEGNVDSIVYASKQTSESIFKRLFK